MSVINQVLLNLEKRRASPAERELLPDHVHVLPESGHAPYWGWVAAGAALAVSAPAGWMALTATIAGPMRGHAPRIAAERASETVIAPSGRASRAEVADVRDDSDSRALGALRLSLELSSLPAELARADGAGDVQREPLATARLTAQPGDPAAPARSEAGRRAAPSPDRSAGMAAANPQIRKQVREPTPRELAENEYRKAVASLDQRRFAEAEEGFRAALSLHPENHQARHGLAGLLVQARKLEDAERVVEEGVKLSPAQYGFTVVLARLQAERGEVAQAVATLQKGLEHAQGSAEYIAFLARAPSVRGTLRQPMRKRSHWCRPARFRSPSPPRTGRALPPFVNTRRPCRKKTCAHVPALPSAVSRNSPP